MGAPYNVTSVTGYNTNPPADDGSETEANRVKWSTIKSKLNDPVKAAIETNFAAIATAFGKVVGGAGITTTAISYSVQSSDQGKLIVATASGITITTPDATDAGQPFVWALSNDSSGDITLDGFSAQTIDGDATVTVPSGKGLMLFTDGSNWRSAGRGWETSVLPPGYLFGLSMSNGDGAGGGDTTNDITVGPGRCRDSSNTVDLTLSSSRTKQIDASWVVGTNQGGRSSAGLADDTWHVHVIGKAFGLDADVLFHNAIDPTSVLPTDYLYYRRIGSIIRVSSAILQFVQDGNHFQLKTPVRDENNTSLSSTASTLTLESIPDDIRVLAEFNATLSTGGQSWVYFSDLSTTDLAPTLTAGGAAPGSSMGWTGSGVASAMIHAQKHSVRTNTSRQIRARSDTSRALDLYTLGWWDTRGRDE